MATGAQAGATAFGAERGGTDMKVLILAGLFSFAACPFAAAETSAQWQIDETRRAEQQRAAPPPAPNVARPVIAQRQEASARRAP